MTTSQITQIKNGSFALPKPMQKSWRNASVYMSASEDTILLKRVDAPSSKTVLSSETVRKLQSLGMRVGLKDIRAAIRGARSGVRKDA